MIASVPRVGRVECPPRHPAAVLRCLLLIPAALLIAACGSSSQAPIEPDARLPDDPQDRARHCYLVLTLTIDQISQFEGTGPQDGFRSRRSTDDLQRARSRMAAMLDETLLAGLRADPRPGLVRLLEEFDSNDDGQLSSRDEVEAFNRHVAACVRPGSS